jgi:hypothetical protein
VLEEEGCSRVVGRDSAVEGEWLTATSQARDLPDWIIPKIKVFARASPSDK